MLEAVGAERAVLSILFKKPELLFQIDDVVSEQDFTNSGAKVIYSLIKNLLLEDAAAQIDYYTLISRAEERGLKDFLSLTHNGELLRAIEKTNVDIATLGRHVNAVKSATIKRVTIATLDNLKDNVEEFSGPPIDLKNMVENTVFGAMQSLDRGDDDIVCLADTFEQSINTYADLNEIIGLNVGFPRWQRDCGGIRNGTVTGLFARAKAGKSQFSAHCAVKVAVEQRLPTLYLDTELQLRNQQMRVAGILSGIPYSRIESGAWKESKEEVGKIKRAFEVVKDSPFYYKNISGRSYHHVLPVIRKFFHQKVRESKGDIPRCLVIYDYIKLMDMNDLKAAAEWQILGFLLSAIHDVAAQLNIPILALGQLNREALRVDSEATIAGSDRITHNVDSLTIMRAKRPEEIELDGEQRGNYMLKALLARNGPGHDYNDWVNVHFDKGAGQFVEDKRNSEILAAIQALRPIAERLEEDDIGQFGSVRED